VHAIDSTGKEPLSCELQAWFKANRRVLGSLLQANVFDLLPDLIP
jgi:hypothetical protein